MSAESETVQHRRVDMGFTCRSTDDLTEPFLGGIVEVDCGMDDAVSNRQGDHGGRDPAAGTAEVAMQTFRTTDRELIHLRPERRTNRIRFGVVT